MWKGFLSSRYEQDGLLRTPAGCVIIICSSFKHSLTICGDIVYFNALQGATAIISITQWGKASLGDRRSGVRLQPHNYWLDFLNPIRHSKCMYSSRSELSALASTEYTWVSVPAVDALNKNNISRSLGRPHKVTDSVSSALHKSNPMMERAVWQFVRAAAGMGWLNQECFLFFRSSFPLLVLRTPLVPLPTQRALSAPTGLSTLWHTGTASICLLRMALSSPQTVK